VREKGRSGRRVQRAEQEPVLKCTETALRAAAKPKLYLTLSSSEKSSMRRLKHSSAENAKSTLNPHVHGLVAEIDHAALSYKYP